MTKLNFNTNYAGIHTIQIFYKINKQGCQHSKERISPIIRTLTNEELFIFNKIFVNIKDA